MINLENPTNNSLSPLSYDAVKHFFFQEVGSAKIIGESGFYSPRLRQTDTKN